MNIKRKAFIQNYVKFFGNITSTCKAIGIDRRTYYNWMEGDEEFKKAIETSEPKEVYKDFIEAKLQKLIQEDSPAAVIFAAKTQCKDRGYVERQEITGKDGTELMTWNIQPVKSNGNK